MEKKAMISVYGIRLTLLTVMISSMTALHAQEIADGVYWVYFKDKAGNGYTIDRPWDFLSERSIQRRAWQGLGIDAYDLPVNGDYVEQIRQLGAQVRHISRWLNGIAIVGADSLLFEQVLAKPFTDTLAWEPVSEEVFYPPKPGGQRFNPPLASPPGYDYGVATEQVTQLSMQFLHQMGYTGEGVWIAVLDGGFRNVDSLPSFVPLINDERLLGTRNFVNDRSVFRESSAHGMYVLSTMAGEWDGNMVGTAPHASYFLATTENTSRETRIEEIAWIEAAELVDSLGYDVINTSLGYSDFDGTRYDYTYEDMDGETTFISRAAAMTASRGIISSNSAGNSGNDPWLYITAPADATGILAVGAADSIGKISGFSSRGPSFDGRIKPEVAAMGVASGLQSLSGGLARGSGTSFASPILAGSVASLWQAYPELPALEMIRTVYESGHLSQQPDTLFGYGIPNFARAYWSVTRVPAHFEPGRLELYPNPASDRVMLKLPGEVPGIHRLRIFDMSGKLVRSVETELPGEVPLPSSLRPGFYILEVRTAGAVYRSRLIKE